MRQAGAGALAERAKAGSISQYGGSPKCAARNSVNATVFGGTNARLGYTAQIATVSASG